MIFIFLTLLGSVFGLNTGVYPVQRQDYVWNGEPVAAPYQAYPPRPANNVYRVSRQEFRPLPYVGFHPPPGPPQTEVWYPPMMNGNEHQIYQLSPRIQAPISGNGYVPQLFVPASNQVIPNLNNDQSSSRRPILPYPSETTTEDNSILSATRTSLIDEGKPLPPVSEYFFNNINNRPTKTYISLNDEVEIDGEQKDLLKARNPTYMDTIEPVSQVDRFRRQIMHVIEVPKQEVVESETVDSSTSGFDEKVPSPDQTQRLLTFKDLWHHQGDWIPKFSDKNGAKYFSPTQDIYIPSVHNEDELSTHLEEDEEEVTEESWQDMNPTEVNSAEIMERIFDVALRKQTPPVFIPAPTLKHFPVWEYPGFSYNANREDYGDIDAAPTDTSEGNEEIAGDMSGHTERVDLDEFVHVLFAPRKSLMNDEETEMAATENLYESSEEVTSTPKEVTTTIKDDESSDLMDEKLKTLLLLMREAVLEKRTMRSNEVSVTARPAETTTDATEITTNENDETTQSTSDTTTTTESTTIMESFTEGTHFPNVVGSVNVNLVIEENPSEDEVAEAVISIDIDFLEDEAKVKITGIVPDMPIDEAKLEQSGY